MEGRTLSEVQVALNLPYKLVDGLHGHPRSINKMQVSARASSASTAAFRGARVAPRVANRAASRRSAVAVQASAAATKPLVGGPAPGFKAQAVFDQEFTEVRPSVQFSPLPSRPRKHRGLCA